MLFLCFARRGTGLGCGAESARTLGAGQTPRTGQSKGRHGDHKRSAKISENKPGRRRMGELSICLVKSKELCRKVQMYDMYDKLKYD